MRGGALTFRLGTGRLRGSDGVACGRRVAEGAAGRPWHWGVLRPWGGNGALQSGAARVTMAAMGGDGHSAVATCCCGRMNILL